MYNLWCFAPAPPAGPSNAGGARLKLKFDRDAVISVVFIAFLFVVLAGTGARLYVNRQETLTLYAQTAGANAGAAAKVKAAAFAVYAKLNGLDADLFRRTDFINLHGLVNRAMGNRIMEEKNSGERSVVKLDDGYLTFVAPRPDGGFAQKSAAAIASFGSQLAASGSRLLYVQMPFKINSLDPQLPRGVADYTNIKASGLLGALEARGVATFDLRQRILEQRLDYQALFFRTDHHWLPSTGLWAAGEMCGELNKNFGFSADAGLIDPANFTRTVYQKSWLGSQGKRVGKYYAGLDDFEVLLPKENTDFYYYYTSGSTSFQKRGRFEDTLVNQKYLQHGNLFVKNCYMYYLGEDHGLKVIKNMNAPQDKKLLIIGDSYCAAFLPFLALAANAEIRLLDLRHYEGSAAEYAELYRPDLTVIAYYPLTFEKPEAFDFNG